MGQITVYSGVERRRHWSGEQKRALVDAGHAKAGFASVIVSAEPRDAAVPPQAMLVEIGGSVVRIAADAPAKLVTAVLRSLAR